MVRQLLLWKNNFRSGVNLTDPENIYATDIKGLGARIGLKKHQQDIYNLDFDFENITMTLNFFPNAYKKYDAFKKIINENGRNPFMLEYKTEKSQERRYCDVYVTNITRAEKTNYNILSETLTLARTTPFYELVDLPKITSFPFFSEQLRNDFYADLPVNFSYKGPANNFTIKIGENETRIKDDVTEFYIDSVNKNVRNYVLDGDIMYIKNGYENLDLSKNTFLYFPQGRHQIKIENAKVTTNVEATFKIKKWVND